MNAGNLLGILTPYRAKIVKLVENQDTRDIVRNILIYHNLYRSEYDKISDKFIGKDPRQTLKNVFNFLKQNVSYKIESENRQTLKSPAAIIATGKTTGSDCKNYALFIAGIAESLTRLKIQNIPVTYRFASYKWYDEQPQHVFIVAFPGTKDEIWIDPVLDKFDEKKRYNHSTDKKMALVGISGTENKQAISGIKDLFKNVKNAVLVVAAAPARAAFLTIVSLNILKTAEKLRIAEKKHPADLQKWWQNLGGNYAKLLEVIDKGMTRKNVGQVGEVLTLSAIIAAASPVVIALVEFLKSHKIDHSELQGAADAGISQRANAAALPYNLQQEINAQQYENGQNLTNGDKVPNFAIIGGVVLLAYFIMKK